MEMEIHEVAALFPLLTPDAFAQLVADIRENGLREAIWTYHNQIIDGRHRYQACQKAGIVPTFRAWDECGSLVSFVVSLNLHRRHISSSQRAIVALEIEKLLAAEAKEKEQLRKSTFETFQKSSGNLFHAAKQAASLMGTNPHYVVDAKKIVELAPDLKEVIKGGVLTIPEAKQIARLPLPQRTLIVQQVATGQVHSPKKALLALHQAEQETQAMAAVSKPPIERASWETWLPHQPLCDLLLTDPPYMTDVKDIEDFARSWLPLALSRVKPSTGRAYVFVGAYPEELAAYLSLRKELPLPLQQVLVWTYKNTLGPSPAYDYKKNWQAILYFRGAEAPPLNCPILTEQWSVQEMSTPDGRLAERYHPWQKPTALAERLIRHSTKPDDLILDPFCGTGTFLLAAHRLGRQARGCEISEEMLVLARRRGCELIEETEVAMTSSPRSSNLPPSNMIHLASLSGEDVTTKGA